MRITVLETSNLLAYYTFAAHKLGGIGCSPVPPFAFPSIFTPMQRSY